MAGKTRYYQGPTQTTEVDFGATPSQSAKTFTITDDRCSSSSRITVVLDYTAPTGKDLDELDMDHIIVTAGTAAEGSFSVHVSSADGSYLADTFRLTYNLN